MTEERIDFASFTVVLNLFNSSDTTTILSIWWLCSTSKLLRHRSWTWSKNVLASSICLENEEQTSSFEVHNYFICFLFSSCISVIQSWRLDNDLILSFIWSLSSFITISSIVSKSVQLLCWCAKHALQHNFLWSLQNSSRSFPLWIVHFSSISISSLNVYVSIISTILWFWRIGTRL